MPETPVNEGYRDKIRGMILLGAYGDALGVPHEPAGLRGEVGYPGATRRLRPAGEFHDGPGQPWAIWPPAEVAATHRGVPSDDTACRLALLEPWLAAVAGRRRAFDESSFFEWMQEREAALAARPDRGPDDWLMRMAAAQMADWLVMRDVAAGRTQRARARGRNAFYQPGVPMCFGVFLYLEAAAAFGDVSPDRTRHVFGDLCILDEGCAAAVTAALAVCLARAVGSDPHEARSSFAAWWFAQLRAERDTLARCGDHDVAAALDRIIGVSEHFAAAAGPHDDHTLLHRYRQEVHDPRTALLGCGSSPHDPLAVLLLMTAMTAAGGDDLVRTFRLLAAAPGDCDTAGSFLGLIAGAWHGERRLRTVTASNVRLADELDAVEHALRHLFHVDPDERADVFTRLRRTVRHAIATPPP